MSPSRSDHTVRCFSPRLGSSLQWDKDWRSLDRSLHIRTSGRILCNQNLCQTQEKDPDLTADGQQHGSCLREQDGGYTFTKSVPPGLPPVAMVPTEGNPPVCRTPSRGCEHNSGPGIQADRSFNRMEAAQGSIPLDSADPRPLPDGPVCNQVKPSTRQLHQLETRSLCSGN